MTERQLTVLMAFHQLPARVNAWLAACLLGFQETDIPILVRWKLLKPLGNPPKSAAKYFATVYILRLKNDEAWMNKATATLHKYWKDKNNGRRQHVDTATVDGRAFRARSPGRAESKLVNSRSQAA